jgi:hypothetical protein
MRYVKMRCALPLALLVLIGSSTVVASAECWKPRSADSKEEAWRQEDKNLYLRAYGDFTGRGGKDYAEIMSACAGKKSALFVYLQRSPGKYARHLLTAIQEDQVSAYGVQTVQPGLYEGACKKGYFDCRPGQVEADAKHQSIKLFKYDGVESVFYFDNRLKKFRRIWTSD